LQRLLCFYSDPAGGQSPQYVAGTESTPGHRNYDHEPHLAQIKDIRGHENAFSLSTHSFAALPNVYAETACSADFRNKKENTKEFLGVADNILMENLEDVDLLVRFDVQIRRASRFKTPARQVHKIHIDQSPLGALRRAQRHLPEHIFNLIEEDQLRLRIINIWKPIEGTVRDHPLAFADCRTMSPADLVVVPQIYPNYVGETYAVRHGAHQQFWYWSGMSVRDVLLLQCFDSHADVNNTGKFGIPYGQCAHGTFNLREEGEEEFNRASIEVRYLVVGPRKVRAGVSGVGELKLEDATVTQ
jgi:hypothetical protein